MDDDDSDSSEGVQLTAERTQVEAREERMARARVEGRHIDLTGGGDGGDDGDEWRPSTPGARGARPRKRARVRGKRGDDVTAATICARVVSGPIGGATGCAPPSPREGEEDAELAAIKRRVKKMLARGLHAGTPEAEANSAMRLAERLLHRFNLDKARLLADAEEEGSAGAAASLAGGSASVELYNPCTNRGVNIPEWTSNAAAAAAENFSVRWYFNRDAAIGLSSFTFYGVTSGAQLAAVAFSAVCNRIVKMGAAHEVDPSEFARRGGAELSGVRSAAAFTKAARESYRRGLALGLFDAVSAAKRERAERNRRRLSTARARVSSGEAWRQTASDEESDSDAAADDDESAAADARSTPADGERRSEQGKGERRTPAAAQAEHAACAPGDVELAEGESRARAALVKLERQQAASHALVAHSEKIFEQQLHAAGINKLSRARARQRSTVHRHLGAHFAEGRCDADKININQREIALKDIKDPGPL